MALGKYKESFEMNRLLSQGDKSPHKAVEKFLGTLGFEKICDGRHETTAHEFFICLFIHCL